MNIYLIISLIFSTTLSAFTVKNFSNCNMSVKKFLIYFFIMFPFFLLINVYFKGYIKLISVIVLMTIALYYSLMDKKATDSLYYTLVYELFVFVIEIVLSIIFVSLTKLNLQDNYSILMLVFSILDSLTIYFISKINKLNKALIKFKDHIFKKKYEKIYTSIIFILLLLMICFNFKNFEKDLSF